MIKLCYWSQMWSNYFYNKYRGTNRGSSSRQSCIAASLMSIFYAEIVLVTAEQSGRCHMTINYEEGGCSALKKTKKTIACLKPNSEQIKNILCNRVVPALQGLIARYVLGRNKRRFTYPILHSSLPVLLFLHSWVIPTSPDMSLLFLFLSNHKKIFRK